MGAFINNCEPELFLILQLIVNDILWKIKKVVMGIDLSGVCFMNF